MTILYMNFYDLFHFIGNISMANVPRSNEHTIWPYSLWVREKQLPIWLLSNLSLFPMWRGFWRGFCYLITIFLTPVCKFGVHAMPTLRDIQYSQTKISVHWNLENVLENPANTQHSNLIFVKKVPIYFCAVCMLKESPGPFIWSLYLRIQRGYEFCQVPKVTRKSLIKCPIT